MTQPPTQGDAEQPITREEARSAVADGRQLAWERLLEGSSADGPGRIDITPEERRRLTTEADALIEGHLYEFRATRAPHSAAEVLSVIQDLVENPWTSVPEQDVTELVDHLNSFMEPGAQHLRELMAYPRRGYAPEAMIGALAPEIAASARAERLRAEQLSTDEMQKRIDPYLSERSEAQETSDREPVNVARLHAVWVQATAEARTLLEHGHTDALREKIEGLDLNLSEYLDGEVPPGSPEEVEWILPDAIARMALPFDSNGPDPQEVLAEYRDRGYVIPELTSGSIQEATGVIALTPTQIANAFSAQHEPSPELKDVAAARSDVRQAIRSLRDGAESVRAHLLQANKALTSAVERMRPETTDDVSQAHESVQQASKTAEHVAETAAQIEAGITVYTSPDCPGCFATKRALDKAELPYNEIDLSTRPDLVAQFKQQGFAQAPIVEAGGETWSGFRPDKMKGLTSDYQQRTRNDRQGPDTGHGR